MSGMKSWQLYLGDVEKIWWSYVNDEGYIVVYI